jgi:hypothetical protein
VAELVDAHGSGPCGLKTVGVRVPSSAPHSHFRAQFQRVAPFVFALVAVGGGEVADRADSAVNMLLLSGSGGGGKNQAPEDGAIRWILASLPRPQKSPSLYHRRTYPPLGKRFPLLVVQVALKKPHEEQSVQARRPPSPSAMTLRDPHENERWGYSGEKPEPSPSRLRQRCTARQVPLAPYPYFFPRTQGGRTLKFAESRTAENSPFPIQPCQFPYP